MKSQTGFTLLEVLVAIALTSLLLTSIYGVFSTTGAAQEQVEKRGAALHLARVLIARLDRELLGLAMENRNQAAALAGGRNSLAEPYLELLTNSSGRQHGMRRIRYRLGPDTDGQMTLWRSEKNINTPSDGTEESLARGIENLSFTFFDGREWRNDWNSLSDGRPLLVRAELELADAGGVPPLLGTFDLPMAGRTP